ncbi:putative transposase [Escherichia coli]|nr:putative transposase [Escherichia coli]CTW39539.1 putative transposase [Escherichia coli]
MAHARRKIHDVHARAPTYITTEALQRIGELYVIEAEVRGCSAEQRLAARKARAAPLMQSLYDWIQAQMKTLSRHSDTSKAFAYLLKQWDSLNVYCSNGQVEIDNNIAENVLRGVVVGRKNWLFVGFRQRWRTCGGVVLANRHMPSEQYRARKMAALRY